MHIAIAVGTMLLGGWVLNSPTDEDQTQQTGVAGQAAPSTPLPVNTRRPPLKDRRDARTSQEDEDQTRQGEQAGLKRDRSAQMEQQARKRRQQQMTVPTSPTEELPPGGEAMLGQPASPTSPILPGVASSGTQTQGVGGAAFGTRHPTAPTAGRGGDSDAYRPRARSAVGQMEGQQTRAGAGMGGTASFMAPPASMPDKAFSGYRPTSGVSPWLNMFRRDSLGTVDNYTTLVRPQLDQRYLNQQFGQDIGGLERNARMQGYNLMQQNQQQRSLQGVGTPQFYMNYGNYYQYQGYGQ